MVDAVALAPGGAHPSYAHGYYERDNDFYVAWDEISRDRDRFQAWMQRHVLETADVDEYRASLAQVDGMSARERDVHRRRDDGGRGGAPAARRHRLLRRDRPAEPRREPRPPHARAGLRARSTRAGRSAPSRRELPLSIGDGELAETADAVVSVPEMFAYWLQGGRIDVGFLGAAQIDRHGNLNSTVIGDYDTPKVRLPGGGGAPEIATRRRATCS